MQTHSESHTLSIPWPPAQLTVRCISLILRPSSALVYYSKDGGEGLGDFITCDDIG